MVRSTAEEGEENVGIVDLASQNIHGLLNAEGFACPCGKIHRTEVRELVIKPGALQEIPKVVRSAGGSRVFLLADPNTYSAAARRVAVLLEAAGVPHSSFIFQEEHVQATDGALAQVLEHFTPESDLILGVGSGTINDIGKLAAKVLGVGYICAATAPSMDGFISSTSSMVMRGIKESVPSVTPHALIADLDVLAQAPKRLLQAGFGDILAKYVSILEWRISHLVTGEYYCPEIAELVRLAVRSSVSQVEQLAKGDREAVKILLESLLLSGLAMSFAGITRPASGVEHYFSHVWEMRHLEFGTPQDFHGLQCGIGTVLAAEIYEIIQGLTPDEERALNYVEGFDLEVWHAFVRCFLGKSGERLVELEEKEQKYSREGHKRRLKRITAHWDQIRSIIAQELPTVDVLRGYLETIGAPVSPREIGLDYRQARRAFLVSKDIRNKYNASMLLWDLGLLDEVVKSLWRGKRERE